MLELLNRDRANPNSAAARNGIALNAGLASGTISSAAKQPLAFNFDLISAARDHSQWMLDTNTFSHTGEGNSSARQRMIDAGYNFTGRASSGENLAYNGTTGTINIVSTIASQSDGLFVSEGHRTNAMGSAFSEIGIGSLTGQFLGPDNNGINRNFNALMSTQKFAHTDASSAFLTGVAFDDAITNDDFYNVGEGLSGITVSAVRTDNNQSFSTTTYDSGGYQLSLNPGTYEVSFSGGGLNSTFQRYVTISNRNIKLDLDTSLSTALQPLRSSTAPAPSQPEGSTTPAFLAWNTVTSMVSSFQLDAANLTASVTDMGRTIEDTNWKLQTTGDLNGDGQDDILLRNFVAGQNLLWQMTPNGEAIAQERLIGRDVPDANWSLSGTGDFDGDGINDILLRNEAADQIVAWYMNTDGTIKSESLVGRGFGDNNWKIVATEDFNGDEFTDILLNNALSGQTLLWTMNGSSIIGEALVGRIVADQDWSIEGAKDFNSNGTTDIFWRHSSGIGLLWNMQSPTVIGQEQIIANVPGEVSQLVL